MRRSASWILFILLLVTILGGLAMAKGGKTVTREALRWTGKLAAAQSLRLRNVNGSIKIEAAAGDTAEIVATETRPDGMTEQATVQAVPAKDGLVVCVMYPGEPGHCEADGRYDAGGDGNDGLSVALVVKLPRGVLVDAMTVNGEIGVRGASAQVRAVTVNGSVDVETGGAPLKVETVNGQVRVRVGAGDVKAKTVNGSVEVAVPAALDAEVRAETVHGSIDNDFGLRAEGDYGQRSLRGKVGKGTNKVTLQTVNGSIRLLKQ